MMTSTTETIEHTYGIIRENLQEKGIDTESALHTLAKIPLSIHCWQGDDINGNEKAHAGMSGGGIEVTGNYPGKARTMDELRQDLKQVLSLVPGKHRINLHAIYGDFEDKDIDRNKIESGNFDVWLTWAKDLGINLDFNATCFAHPKADDGFTLSHSDADIRKFWIEHVRRCREITAYFGKMQNTFSIHNLWIPDGSKETPYDRKGPRARLVESLDEIYKDRYPASQVKDAVESKLFGIGSESFVTGSFEFYLGYVLKHNLMMCLDMGHFHPTENVADKISSLMQFSDELLMHISRGVRWDSDHVPILNDEVLAVALELVRGDYLKRVHVALDYFDASINRIGAYILGIRTVQKALLLALLEPAKLIKDAEERGDYFTRLALMEENKNLPLGIIWDYFCLIHNVPHSGKWLSAVYAYEKNVLRNRG
jgi:L-rhamnose isomerase